MLFRSFPVKGDRLGPPSVWATIPGGHPDGMTLDAEGNVYVAMTDGHAIAILNRSGDSISTIPTPGMFPTNVTFGGAGREVLFVTAASGGRVLRVRP